MKIRQHIPNFVSGIEPETAEFTNLVELLSIPFVARFRDDYSFEHYAVSTHEPSDDWLLMAVYDAGHRWWVVGYMDGLPPEEMIQWRPPEER